MLLPPKLVYWKMKFIKYDFSVMMMTMMTLHNCVWQKNYTYAFAFPSRVPTNKPIDKIFIPTFYLFFFQFMSWHIWHDRVNENVIYWFSLVLHRHTHAHIHSIFINNNKHLSKNIWSKFVIFFWFVLYTQMPHFYPNILYCFFLVRDSFSAINSWYSLLSTHSISWSCDILSRCFR